MAWTRSWPAGLAAALHRLRGEIRERVPMPGAARLRARAIRQLRVRRTATVLAAADDGLEAIMLASCAPSEDGIASGHSSHLIIVSRNDDGTLSGRGWAGPAGAAYQSWWVADGRLLVSVDMWAPDAQEPVPTAPGMALAYEWEGELGFVGGDPAPEYPLLRPVDLEEIGPPVRPRATVATGLGCPDEVVRFANSIDDGEWPWMAPTNADAMYALPPQDGGQLFDLDRNGERLLVVALSCLQLGNVSTDGLAVFERADGGWQGISVLVSPIGQPPVRWSAEGDRFTVEWAEGTREAYRWTGTELISVDD